MKIFISHASEDKDALARPLAMALRDHVEVWYDEYELRLGDSLREKIDKGLRACDFGVVVLSPNFFQKKWTKAELGGLFSLEDENRKVILPVWYNIDAEQVRQHSPILADRLAVSANHGVERVVQEILVAVGAVSRAQEVLDRDGTQAEMRRMMAEISGYELDQKILGSEIGSRLVREATSRIGEGILRRLESLNTEKAVRFRDHNNVRYFTVAGPYGFRLSVLPRDLYVNTASSARLTAHIFVEMGMFEGEGATQEISTMEWRPTCVSEDRLAFVDVITHLVVTETEVVNRIVAFFCSMIQGHVAKKRHG
jgi:hypothetical protein